MRTALVALLLAAQTSSPIFRFETEGFWLNLHHYLYVLGRVEAKMPDINRRAVARAPIDQAEGLKSVSEAERQAWNESVAFYARGLSRLNAIFDGELIAATNMLRRVQENTSPSKLKLDPAVAAALSRAAPIYLKVWWPRHQEANRARVREYTRLVDDHGPEVLAYLTRVYQEPWPKDGFPVNLSGYANWAGAYSTRGQLLVVSSLDEGTAGSLGLESIFHETMHQWDDAIYARLSRLQKQHQTPPVREDLTHALIWYTVAEAVKSVIPAHRGYAEVGGMWNQKGLGSFKPALDLHWKPYLDGKGTLDDALLAILR